MAIEQVLSDKDSEDEVDDDCTGVAKRMHLTRGRICTAQTSASGGAWMHRKRTKGWNLNTLVLKGSR